MRIESLAFVGGLIASASLFAAPPVCYFLQSSDCGTGANFCIEDQVVCDVGYGTTDTGVGVLGPLTGTMPRVCYKITNTVTSACNGQYSGGGVTIGCKDGGVCCFADREFDSYVGGNMQTPSSTIPCGNSESED